MNQKKALLSVITLTFIIASTTTLSASESAPESASESASSLFEVGETHPYLAPKSIFKAKSQCAKVSVAQAK
jgi:hypothetical protein